MATTKPEPPQQPIHGDSPHSYEDAVHNALHSDEFQRYGEELKRSDSAESHRFSVALSAVASPHTPWHITTFRATVTYEAQE